jgi:hypothetical protein
MKEEKEQTYWVKFELPSSSLEPVEKYQWVQHILCEISRNPFTIDKKQFFSNCTFKCHGIQPLNVLNVCPFATPWSYKYYKCAQAIETGFVL